MSDLTPVPRPQFQLGTTPPFEDLVDATLRSVSESSRPVYQSTYYAWGDWVHNHGTHPFNFSQVRAFLIDQPVSMASRKRMLSAMRTLVETLAAIESTARQIDSYHLKVPGARWNLDNSQTNGRLSPLVVSYTWSARRITCF